MLGGEWHLRRHARGIIDQGEVRGSTPNCMGGCGWWVEKKSLFHIENAWPSACRHFGGLLHKENVAYEWRFTTTVYLQFRTPLNTG